MKKFIFIFTCFLTLTLLTGCGMGNTPTQKVESFLNKYRNLDSEVTNQMNDVVEQDSLMTDTQRNDYKNILKKQYEDLVYTVKDEKIDGNNAIVTVEIEVYDFYKVTKDADIYYNNNLNEFMDETGNLSQNKFVEYRLEQLKTNKEKIKYTIDFTLKKIDNVWIMDDIDDVTRQKIHGLYAY